jgi:CheY-like chemotaxis protein
MAMILAVDDDPDIRAVIEVTLESAGHKVVGAAGGEEAINKLRRRRFDLVLLDIMMPNVNGYQVLEQIRGMPSRAATPVVVITAKHDPEGLLKEIGQGIVDHLVKPFSAAELLAVVERAIEGEDQQVTERRRVLSNEAEMYGAIDELYKDVRSNPTDKR